MARRLGEAVKRRPNFNESLWDKDRSTAIAALPDFRIAVVGTGVPFRAELLALRHRSAREIWPREGVLAGGSAGSSLPSARGKRIRPGTGAGS